MNTPQHLLRWFLVLLVLGVLSFSSFVYFIRLKPQQPKLFDDQALDKMLVFLNDNDVLSDKFLENNKNESFPKETICHYTGLRKTPRMHAQNMLRNNIACKPHRPTEDACKDANQRYSGPGVIPEERKCDETKYDDICKFVPSKTKHVPSQLSCSTSACGKEPVYYGTVDPSQGILGPWKLVEPFTANNVLQLVKDTKKDGFEFGFLKCKSIMQVLVFEPISKLNSTWDPLKRININMVVLDSISRPHFYRMLRQSVTAMRSVIYDESVKATVLDFELFQAIAQHTFENIRTLFSGRVRGNEKFSGKVKQALEPLGIEVLYKRYQNLGYQTMFQEDLCWYDHWGIMLTNLEYRSDMPQSAADYKKRWKEFESTVSKYHVEKYGLTHFSCPVVQKYDLTNHYDRPDKVCFNGKFFSKYFLEYIVSVHKTIEENEQAAPIISYQHFNTGHTPGGTRIRNIDRGLAEFIHSMANDPNTLTIILADHGHTRTGYGGTIEGKYELYNPLLFMIVPHHVAHLLGKKAMSALVLNQRRLLTTMDVHKALMALHDHDKMDSGDHSEAGVFALLPANRTCGDLIITPLAKCRCEIKNMKFPDNSPKHKWLAEYALGKINNAIQDQYIKGQKVTVQGKPKTGYGRCTRLVGKSIRNIVEHQSGQYINVFFDLHVASAPGIQEDEVFQIAIKRSITDESWLEFSTPNRHSLYSKFKTCRDESVDIKLCVCDIHRKNTTINFDEEYKKHIKRPTFGEKPEIKALHGDCLLLIRRNHDRMTMSYEIANFCSDKKFQVTMSGSPDGVILSDRLPVNMYFMSKSVYFVLSAVRRILNHSYFDESITVTVL